MLLVSSAELLHAMQSSLRAKILCIAAFQQTAGHCCSAYLHQPRALIALDVGPEGASHGDRIPQLHAHRAGSQVYHYLSPHSGSLSMHRHAS